MKSFGLINDIWASRQLWFTLSKLDLVSRFRGTRLGLAWLLISQIGTFYITALIWSKIFKLDFNDFFIYIGLGFATWGFISNSIAYSASSVFSGISTYLNSNTPMVVGPCRVTAANLYVFVLGIFIPVTLSLAINQIPFANLVLLFVGLILMILFVLTISIIVSVISIKYKDIPQALGVVFQLLFVISPIIYTAEMLESRGIGFFADINPFYWALYVVREPLISASFPDLKYYSYLALITVTFSVISILFVTKNSRKYLLHA